MNSIRRKILLLNMVHRGETRLESLEFEGQTYDLHEYRLGYDYSAAEHLIKSTDGEYSAIGLMGVVRKLTAGKTQVNFPGYLKLIRASIKTPVCVMDQTRDFFGFWSLERLVSDRPRFFDGKKVLFHSAIVTPMVNRIVAQGAQVLSGDASVFLNLPYLLGSQKNIEIFLKSLHFSHRYTDLLKWKPGFRFHGQETTRLFKSKQDQFEVFVSLRNLIETLTDFSFLRGKILIVDSLSPKMTDQVKNAGVKMIITTMPESLNRVISSKFPLSVLTCLLNITKKQQHKTYMDEDEFLLHWVQKHGIEPDPVTYERTSDSEPLKCSFVIHPLSASQIWAQPGFEWMNRMPKPVRNAAETLAAHLPFHRYGQITGIQSHYNGKQVVCELLAMKGTPRELVKMNESLLYQRLIQCSEYSAKTGSKIMGLGAYTKVAGDGGVTVAQQSPIPVTTGNSYSSASTLWSARKAFEKIRPDLRRNADGLYPIRAMVIGATGSIGRVTSFLLAENVTELILAATQSNKLLELQSAVQEKHPSCKIRITTNAELEVSSADLIITTTSNRGRKLLNVQKIKSGAVVCDCSRPLDFTREDVLSRPDVLFIESGEITLPGNIHLSKPIGLRGKAVYACLAETILLTLEGRYEAFSYSRVISPEKVKEIYKLGLKHGFELSPLSGPSGLITQVQIDTLKKIHQQNSISSRLNLVSTGQS